MKKKGNFYTFGKKTRFFNSSVWKYAQNQTLSFSLMEKTLEVLKLRKTNWEKMIIKFLMAIFLVIFSTSLKRETLIKI